MPSSRREVVPRAGVDGRLRQNLARRHTNRLTLSNAPLASLSLFVSTWSDAPLASPGGNRWLAEAVFGRGQGRVVKLGDLRRRHGLSSGSIPSNGPAMAARFSVNVTVPSSTRCSGVGSDGAELSPFAARRSLIFSISAAR